MTNPRYQAEWVELQPLAAPEPTHTREPSRRYLISAGFQSRNSHPSSLPYAHQNTAIRAFHVIDIDTAFHGFLGLAPELQLSIIEYVTTSSKTIVWKGCSGSHKRHKRPLKCNKSSSRPRKNIASLLIVSKHLNTIAAPVFYKRNVFCFLEDQISDSYDFSKLASSVFGKSKLKVINLPLPLSNHTFTTNLKYLIIGDAKVRIVDKTRFTATNESLEERYKVLWEVSKTVIPRKRIPDIASLCPNLVGLVDNIEVPPAALTQSGLPNRRQWTVFGVGLVACASVATGFRLLISLIIYGIHVARGQNPDIWGRG